MWEVMTWSEEWTGRRGSDLVQKVFGTCEAKNGTEIDELLQTGTDGHQRIWKNAENNSNFRRRKSPSPGGTELENKGRKQKITRKEYQRLVNKFEMEGLMAENGLWNLAKEKIMKERGELLIEEGDVVRE